jgi:phosphoadenosine phosphosulfate reductase
MVVMDKRDIKRYQGVLEESSPQDVISWALDNFQLHEIALATSFGAEDQVLTDMLLKENANAQIFTLDTGRLPQETLDTLERTMNFYNVKIKVLSPDSEAVKTMEKEYGPNLFYESIEGRKYCCAVRKIAPLRSELVKLKAWICGLRKDQAVTRGDVNKVEWDEAFGLFKINPLADWSEEQVWQYLRENKIPYNPLHDKGYPSIGCAPCTRAIKTGEDIRSGRWWWENPEQKECGLHPAKGEGAKKEK